MFRRKFLKVLMFVPITFGCFSCSQKGDSSTSITSSTEPFITTVVPSQTSEPTTVTSEPTTVTSEPSVPPAPTSESTTTIPPSSTSSIDPRDIYDEPEDSLEGVDPLDLSGLTNAAKNTGGNYTTINRHFFTDEALAYYYINYAKNLPSEVNHVVTNKYKYLYPVDSSYKTLDAYNTVLYQNGEDIYGANIGTDDYEKLMKKDTFDYASSLVESNKQISDLNFNLGKFDETYLSTHSFTRISKDKYQCVESSVINDFVEIIVPNLQNEGYYMTFTRITVEIGESGLVKRLRLYCNTTQSGKLISSHNEKVAKPNWYMLFAECNVNNIGTTSIPCLDKLYK